MPARARQAHGSCVNSKVAGASAANVPFVPNAHVNTRGPARQSISEGRVNTSTSVCIARGDVAGDLGALGEVAADRLGGRRRAGPVCLLEAAIAAVEAGDQSVAPFARGRLGVDQRLHLVA